MLILEYEREDFKYLQSQNLGSEIVQAKREASRAATRMTPGTGEQGMPGFVPPGSSTRARSQAPGKGRLRVALAISSVGSIGN